MKKITLVALLLSSLSLFALETQTIHSSALFYYEMKDFSNSKQKTDGVSYGVNADIHIKEHEFRLAYEKGLTNTIKSQRMTENLDVDKLFAKYAYTLDKKLTFNFNYINVLSDNMVPTDKSLAYGAGLSYTPFKPLAVNFTQYYTDYQVFKAYQSDLKIDFKAKYKKLKYKLTLMGKYIKLRDKDSNTFSKNAQNSYKTMGVKLHAHYESYHFGAGAFFGKRAFAIMDEGFKIQHHAMEFDKTYAVGFGKSFNNFVLRYQYVYQRAKELPMQNSNVKISNNRVILNYKF